MDLTKTTFLHRSAGLERLGPDALARLASRVTQRRLARRERLWVEGEAATHLYWIRSGVTREVRQLAHGREIVLGFRGRSRILGEAGAVEAAVTGAAVRHGSAEAHEDTTLYALSVNDLAALLSVDAWLSSGLAQLCAQAQRRAELRLGDFLFLSVRARMATVLLELALDFGVRDSRGVIINVKVTHRDLAGLAGASRETASNTLLDWRRDGWVAVEGKRVVLLDSERIQAIAREADL